MCGGTFAVEQAGGGNQTHTGANTGDSDSAAAAALQPRNDGRVPFDDVIDAQACCGNENEIGFGYVGERDIGTDLNTAITVDRSAIVGCGDYAKTRVALRAGEDVPERAGVAEDLWSRSRTVMSLTLPRQGPVLFVNLLMARSPIYNGVSAILWQGKSTAIFEPSETQRLKSHLKKREENGDSTESFKDCERGGGG